MIPLTLIFLIPVNLKETKAFIKETFPQEFLNLASEIEYIHEAINIDEKLREVQKTNSFPLPFFICKGKKSEEEEVFTLAEMLEIPFIGSFSKVDWKGLVNTIKQILEDKNEK